MSISPDQFLAQPSDPDEDGLPLDVDFPLDQPSGSAMAAIGVSLQRTAESLETIAQSFGANAELEDERNTLREEAADLEAKYESLFGLVADIEKLVSKSTSKLANSVRDAINAWKTGTVIDNSPNDEPDGFAEVGDSTGVVVHNHDWASGNTDNSCACGAWIDSNDPEHPNGIVREPGYAPSA